MAIDRTAFKRGTVVTDEDRRQLVAEADRIEASFADHRPVAVAQSLAMIRASFPAAPVDDAGGIAKYEAYKIAVDDRPTWTVERAVFRFIRGEAGTGRFAPSPAELRTETIKIESIERGRASYYRRMATMPVEDFSTEAERAAVIAKHAGTIRQLGSENNHARVAGHSEAVAAKSDPSAARAASGADLPATAHS